MVEPLLIATVFVSFFCTFVVLPFWIKRMKSEGLSGKDIHKLDKKKVAEAGGIVVLFGFSVGLLLYIAVKTFHFDNFSNISQMFALLTTILIAGMLGSTDDLLGWKRGLDNWLRVVLMVFAAVPLMVINAGTHVIQGVDVGFFYPMILIPLGIVGASTTYNFLAGYNGLETSQGILILSALALVNYISGGSWLSIISLCMVAALAAFYIFNKYPSKIFPGDTLTYPIGAFIAIIAILGNIEQVAIFFFIPYILETGLKVRGKLKKESFAKLNEDGSLRHPYRKIYGLEHLAIWFLKKVKPSGKVYEKEVVWSINAFQALVILVGLWLFVI
ncbi:MAG: glycosyl transferase family 4 [Candidatus Pacearchaeota archaeon]